MLNHYEYFRVGPSGGIGGSQFEAAVPPDSEPVDLLGAKGCPFLSHIGLSYRPKDSTDPPSARIEMGKPENGDVHPINKRQIVSVEGRYQQEGDQVGITMLSFQFREGAPIDFGDDLNGFPFSYTFPSEMELAGFYGRHDPKTGVIYAFGVVARRESAVENPFLDRRWRVTSTSCGEKDHFLRFFNTMMGVYAGVVFDKHDRPLPKEECGDLLLSNPVDEASLNKVHHQKFHFNAEEKVLNSLTKGRQISYWTRDASNEDGIHGIWSGLDQAPPWCLLTQANEEEDGSWGAEGGDTE